MTAYINLALSLYFGLTLGIAGLSKLSELKVFVGTMKSHGILPQLIIKPFAVLLIIVEILLSFVMIAGIIPIFISWFNLFIFTSFLFYKAILLKNAPKSYCGCYSKRQSDGD